MEGTREERAMTKRARHSREERDFHEKSEAGTETGEERGRREKTETITRRARQSRDERDIDGKSEEKREERGSDEKSE